MPNKSWKKTVAVAVLATTFIQATPAFAQPLTSSTPSLTPAMQISKMQDDIEILDNDVVETMVAIEELNKRIAENQQKVAQATTEAKETEKELRDLIHLSHQKLRTLQESGSMVFNYINLLVSSENFNDFMDRTTMVATIMQSDQDFANQLTEKKNEQILKEKALSQSLSLLKKDKATAEAQQKSLAKKKAEAQKQLQALQYMQKLQQEAEKKLAEQKKKQELERKRKQEQEALKIANETIKIATISDASSQPINPINTPVNPAEMNPSILLPSSEPNNKANNVIAEAKKYLGVKYVWGGTTPEGFDCSGLTQYVFRTAGVELPRVSRMQQAFGTQVPLNSIMPGDLVFWGQPAHHVGIYIGNGEYLHAPHTGDVVKISKLVPSSVTSVSRVL